MPPIQTFPFDYSSSSSSSSSQKKAKNKLEKLKKWKKSVKRKINSDSSSESIGRNDTEHKRYFRIQSNSEDVERYVKKSVQYSKTLAIQKSHFISNYQKN
jgi:hypothetical protein